MNIIKSISDDLRIDDTYIKEIIKKNDRYKRYSIPKKNGGSRIIYHPSKELKTLQYWVAKNIFSELKISRYSTAYQKGCSIKNNASIHKESNYILHTDIENFFNSITSKHINSLLRKESLNLSEEDIELINKIILYKDRLVIGSVSSPIVANCVMNEFDNDLFEELSKIQKFKYTRYADDMVISSRNFIPNKVLELIDSELQIYEMKRNKRKTYFMSKNMRRIVTGVTIDNNNGELSIGHKNYKNVKKMLYNFLVKDEGDIDEIIGYLSYVKSININSYNNLKTKYQSYEGANRIFK